MDLALEMSMTEGQLRKAMTERELSRWYRYATETPLPALRVEMGLARVCLTLVQVMGGGTEATLADFMFLPKPKKTKSKAEEGAMAIDAIAGTGFRKLGQGRKRKAD